MLLFTTLSALALVGGPAAGPLRLGAFAHHLAGSAEGPQSPHIELNVSDDIYHQGDGVHVSFRSDRDAYVTIFRVDTDGRVRLLFPQDPWEDNFARGDRRYDVDSRRSGRAFVVDDYPGEGYVFAVASADPFDYGAFVRGDHWDYRAIGNGGRIAGDPYEALGDLIDHIVPANYLAYSYDIAPYYVEEHYDYPRFLCYDCHGYNAYPYWNPYRATCVRFRVVIYDDPFYYPARGFVGTRVVYTRPVRPVPRYVFKDRVASEPYVAHLRQRPVDDGGRRVIDRGATARDFGGRPVPIRLPGVPAPTVPTPRRVDPIDQRRVPTPDRATGRDRTALPQPEAPARDERRVPDLPAAPPATPKLERRESAHIEDGRRPLEPESGRIEAPRRMPSDIPQRAEPARQPESRRVEGQVGPMRTPTRSEPARAEPSRQPTRSEPSKASAPPARSGGSSSSSAPPRRRG